MKAGKTHHFYRPPDEYYSTDYLLDWVRSRPLEGGMNVPVCIWGPRGIGKTSQVKAFGKKRGLHVVTYHPAHDVTGQDLLGQQIVGDDGRVRYAIPEFLPHGDNVGQGVWFIDEINRANEEVLAGLMEPLVEGRISQNGWEIPEDWQIVVAANPYEDGYNVRELDAAMVSRMLHYNPGWNAAHWAVWAEEAGISPEVIRFTLSNTDMLEVGSSKIAHQIPKEIEQKLKANPRSMEYFDALIEPGMSTELLRLIGYGLIGRDATEAYIIEQERETEIIEPHQILTVREDEVYSYDQTLLLWGQEPETYPRLVKGTIQILAAELQRRPAPASEDPGQSIDAQMVGRFIASLRPLEQKEALSVILSSCTEWHPAVKKAVEIWKQSMAGAGAVL